jgi:N-formylglutamate amidohydrolase
MSKVLCHIPHSGTYIPEWAKCDIIITVKELHSLVDFMTDKNIDKMWEFVPDKNKVVATHSRLITDMERFRNDSDEPMAEKGMGLYYTHSPAGKMFRIKNEASYIKCLEIYDAHHSLLEERVRNCLNKHSRCIILDCHSFHDEMDYTGYDIKDYPDVCIGINGNMSKESWLITEAFNSKGYSVKVNEPFAGSLKPLLYLNDSCVTSIMIELNRRIYDNLSFKKVQNICKSIYRKLND